MGQDAPFDGAKLALFLGSDLAVILRDNYPGLPFAGYWDLPGGGREGGEGPLDCALRECREELGLNVPRQAVIWRQSFAENTQTKWFFVAQLSAGHAEDVVFGDEGQRWALMDPQEFLAHPKAVPAFQARLRLFLNSQAGG